MRLKPAILAVFILVQIAFIAYGLGLFFWTLNEWLSGRGLNALFGGGLGLFFFFAVWRLLREWVIRREDRSSWFKEPRKP